MVNQAEVVKDDPFDNVDQAVLRRTCFDAYSGMMRLRRDFARSCDHRPFLARRGERARTLHFACLVKAGFLLARARVDAPQDAGTFLHGAPLQDARARNVSIWKRAFGRGREQAQADRLLMDRMSDLLSIYPEFDAAAFACREEQSAEFLAEFEIDYAIISHGAEELAKPERLLNHLESHISGLLPILISYSEAVHNGCSEEEIQQFIEITRVADQAPEMSL